MTNGQSGCFMWMVVITGGIMFFLAVDHGCLAVPAVQNTSEPKIHVPGPIEPSATGAPRFWVDVEVNHPVGMPDQTILASPTATTVIPTPLIGWECKMSQVGSLASPPNTKGMYLLCTHDTAGRVGTGVKCSKDRLHAEAPISVKDAHGNAVVLTAHCSN